MQALARELFYFYLERTLCGMMTRNDFRKAVVFGTMEEGNMPLYVAATYYNRVLHMHLAANPADKDALTVLPVWQEELQARQTASK